MACRWDPDPHDPYLSHSGPASELGRGWKVRPFIRLPASQTAVLADIDGPACINQLWITSNFGEYRKLVFRIFWDDEESPSVEVPLGDFFAMGHDSAPHLVNSLPVVVGPYRGCGCFWQMPFRKHCRVTLENEASEDADIIAYKIMYQPGEIGPELAYFHAQWRRGRTTRERPEHTLIDGVRGAGVYVGTYLAWTSLATGWWGEGEVKYYLDGDGDYPTIADNGTEDYFGGAWCFYRDPHTPIETEFSFPYSGMPLAKIQQPHAPRLFSLYRWHVQDPIGFSKDLRVTVQALGWWPERKYQPLCDDIASVAYWYQTEPHVAFPILPPAPVR
ncbi:MAG: DUF2961 domain-containing protein [Verrucomicrobia bacterium]|nr:DUF2961 domain-containing protein [Verrucomicrobiota bacterium]